MKEKILSHLHTECPWRDTLYWFDTTDSTNTQAALLARQGAPHGTVVVAGHQTGGKGRLGRSFVSPLGGMYLSVILRPRCAPAELMHLTCAAAVAACQAVEQCVGILPRIKWTNDLILGQKKLGGILTGLSCCADGTIDYAIVGIGINCCQKDTDFPEELRAIATSLSAVGKDIDPCMLAAKLVDNLAAMDTNLLAGKKHLMALYRDLCITPGNDIVLLRGEEKRSGKAMDIDENGGLVVRFADGCTETVSSGEVSIRGMYGYL